MTIENQPQPIEPPIIVSACLAGLATTHDGRAKPHPKVLELLRSGKAIPICPEQLGGLPTPRPEAEIIGGDGAAVLDGSARVVDVNGADVTANYLRGAGEALKAAGTAGAIRAILKARSPSCGLGRIYDGTFAGRLVEGSGVTASLLDRSGIAVTSDEDLSR